jgi:Tol biopolymer transport system component
MVSPDGTQIVFPAFSPDGKGQLWLRSLDSLTSRPLEGTENARLPFWSPDSKSIGFFAAGKMKTLEIGGGGAITIADAPDAQGATWSRNGTILFAATATGGLQQIAASGGAARQVTRGVDKTATQRFPCFLPDGRHFIYLFGGFSRRADIRVGSLDSPEKQGRVLLEGVESSAIYSQGYVLFVRGSNLVARPFNPKSLEFTGDAVPVVSPVRVSQHPVNLAEFSVSANGVLVYQEGGSSSLRLTWLDRAGRRLGAVGEAGQFSEWVIKFSPDQKTAAVSALDAPTGNFDIWLYDVLRGLRTRFTSDLAYDGVPVWSPDGGTLVFRSDRAGPGDLYRKPADGSRNEELVFADDLIKDPFSFSPDGKYLAYDAVGDPKTGYDLWVLPDPLQTPGVSKPRPFLRTEFNEDAPQFSPDGHWIAYQSDESGRDEVYVAAFPGPGGKRRISTSGGSDPSWRRDGKELFYLAPDSHLMAATVEIKGGELEVRRIETLFGPLNLAYAASADGQRFLALVPPEGQTGPPLAVVQNWVAQLKK